MVIRDFKDMIRTVEAGKCLSLVWTVRGNDSVDQWVGELDSSFQKFLQMDVSGIGGDPFKDMRSGIV